MQKSAYYSQVEGVEVAGETSDSFRGILTSAAMQFIAGLEREFGERRRDLLRRRALVQAEIDEGKDPDFLNETRSIREDASWRVAPAPEDLQRRWVEITGPTDRKMMINALNSGADVFMADFEDANSPTWENMVNGQINLRDAVERTIRFDSPDGKEYQLNEEIAVLVVRPRGWHLEEKHLLVDGKPISASLFDFGLYFFHNAKNLIDQGSGPYFYLPKLENHREARLWNDVFSKAQEDLSIPKGTIRATVLIENILAAFEMEEILYELRQHASGLNAGRWDYIFSVIKKFRGRQDCLLPDRAQVTMTTPFMRAYTELLVQTCHKRGAHAMGGMAAYIPSRKDPQVNEVALTSVRADKHREVGDGFDGTWVAHPDLVGIARESFNERLGEKPHQKDRLRQDVAVTSRDLLNFEIPEGQITEAGLRTNVSVGLLYLESWLRGIGAAAIFNLMEDTATAEICRSQLWHWNHHSATLSDGRKATPELYQEILMGELAEIRDLVGGENFSEGRFAEAREIFNQLVTSAEFIDFLPLLAYDYLNGKRES
jgi:malate synthase